jgi:transposase InsO family protein
MTTWISDRVTAITQRIELSLARTAGYRRLARARQLASTMQTNRRSFRRAAITAFIAVAMNAERSYTSDNSITFDTDSGPIGVDNRCTGCISHRIDDFEGPLRDSNRSIKGFGGSRTRNIKIGTIAWQWDDNQGKTHKFTIPNSFYVPEGNVRLLSPQHWAQAQNDTKPLQGTGSETTSTDVILFWAQRKYALTIPLGRNDNVATFNMSPGYTQYSAFCATAGFDDTTDLENPIIASPALPDSSDQEKVLHSDPGSVEPEELYCQPIGTDFDLNGPSATTTAVIQDEEDRQPTTLVAELIRYHHRFNHISFPRLQEMAKQGVIPRRLAKCAVPACSACLYAKAIKKPWRSRTSDNRDDSHKPVHPGDCVSVDQLVSPTPGLIAQMTGFRTMKRYRYATVYIDQVSRLSFTHLQKTATAEETLEGKLAFEKYSEQRGVRIRAYHADNGIFKAKQWVLACREKGQNLSFAGVNAHHQNGMAERRIRLLQEITRTMLIHASKRWPNSVTANLWPYALRMANEALNETPSMQDKTRRTAQQIYSGVTIQPNPKHWKPFGCPVYVLDDALQTGNIFHKWKQRSKVGIYLGQSPQHARNVALVLDRQTGYVSPQFHVAFDPSFHTVKDNKDDSLWQVKAGFVSQREHAPSNDAIPPSQTNQPKRTHFDVSPSPEGATGVTKKKIKRTKQSTTTQAPTPETNPEVAPNPLLQLPSARKTETAPLTKAPIDKSSRPKSQPVERLIKAMLAETSRQTANNIEGEIFCLQAMYPITELEKDPLLAYKASSDPDTMYMHQAVKEPDRDNFIEAMQKEVRDQSENGNFSVVHKSKVPRGATTLPSVWQMKRKRDIRTRQIKKWKARLNVDGSRMQQGIHYTDTYAPVASWNSIRMLLTLTAVHSWHTKQLDYVLAFPQAPVEKELYMAIPKGFEIDEGKTDDYALKLHRNVYGQKQAGRVWNKYLVDILTKRVGFVQSKVDECVFYKGQTMYILYTDDSILAGPDEKEIDQIIKDMKKAKLDITIEGDLQDFLGVNIDRKEDGSIHLTQPHLIDQILKDLRLDGETVTGKTVPASSSKILSRHSSSEPFDNSFNYKSVIGKLNYLEKGSRSDIAYITHQCARFTQDPKMEHGQALRWLGRYLRSTRDKGTILRPCDDKDMEIYVDADFAGNWDANETWDRDTARSRHGYIISYAGCPIIWKSQLQTEIALSSTESEYTGLSYALRDGIPMMELLKEMKRMKFPIRSTTPQVHCKVFEDNSGALEIATTHKFRPRTKHLNVKLHHFRDYVTRKEVSIHPISTTQQLADYLTKPVNILILNKLRRTVMGW